MLRTLHRPLLLRGTIVDPDGSARERYVLVRDGRIVEVSRRHPPCAEDTVSVKTDRDDLIFPGLLDLHTHSDYNVLPLWETERAPFPNRFAWRADAGYKADVRGTFETINTAENRDVLAVFAELQAVAGGTSVLQESKSLEAEVKLGAPLLCRDTADPVDLELDPAGTVLSVVDFFRPDPATGEPAPVDRAIESYLKLRAEGKLLATLAHLAEGRSGFGPSGAADPYSRREFEAFMAHPAFADAAAVRSSPMTLIHACGVDAHNPQHLDFLRRRGISIVWSPVSNLLLYGETLDVEALLAAGINVALGSDWSPSGSKHVWDEAKFARFYLEAIESTVADQQIFQMATANAGRCLGQPRFGRIEPGAPGDFFIIRSPLESDNPLETFFKTSDRHVRATIIAGRPIYGAREFLERFEVELQPLPKVEGSAVVDKAVHLPAQIAVDVDRDVGRIEAAMKALPKPVLRSNLLASSDKPYRRRLHELRGKTMALGWAIQELRRRRAAG